MDDTAVKLLLIFALILAINGYGFFNTRSVHAMFGALAACVLSILGVWIVYSAASE